MNPIADFGSTLENVYIDSISPRLPEYRIRLIETSKSPQRVVYLAWVPKSWLAPHMIHSHGTNRYYKRGNFRSVPMHEHEVERLYMQRQGLSSAALNFLKTGDFGEAGFPGGPTLRVVLCPLLLIPNRIDVLSKEFYQRIIITVGPNGRRGEWLPFLDGFRFVSYGKNDQTGVHEFEFRLFSNGAVSLVTGQDHIIENHRVTIWHVVKSHRRLCFEICRPVS
jgi:hypothetical protein